MKRKRYEEILERFASRASRPWRLAVFAFLISLMFPGARFFILAVIFLVALVTSFERGWKTGDWRAIKALAGLLVFCGFVYAAAASEAYRVAKYRHDIGEGVALNLAPGEYEAEAEGARGPVHVRVRIAEGNRITRIESPIETHRETASIGGNALRELNHRYTSRQTPFLRDLNSELEKQPLERAVATVDSITGATLTSRAYRKAVKSALVSAQRNARTMSAFSATIYFFLKNELSKISLNTLAIIFIIVVFFDYTLQGVLVRGTGQAISCMNCQTCVGACPVKQVEMDGKEYAFPMDMVLYTRLGDYETVRKLARYCVGCSRCSGKCPIGISPPNVAAAAIVFLRAKEAEDARATAPAPGGRHA